MSSVSKGSYEKPKKKKKPYVEAPVYPAVNRINILDPVRSPELYWGIFYLVLMKSAMYLNVTSGYSDHPKTILVISAIISLFTITHGIQTAQSRQILKLKPKPVNNGLVIGSVITAFALVYLLGFVFMLFGVETTMETNQQLVNLSFQIESVPSAIIIAAVAPICEELIFREFLPIALGASQFSFFISSVLFVVFHQPSSIGGWVLYSILSAIFLFARLKGNNIIQSIWVHVLYNTIPVFLMYGSGAFDWAMQQLSWLFN